MLVLRRRTPEAPVDVNDLLLAARPQIEGFCTLTIYQNARDFRGSPDRFGYEWGAYAEILPEYEEQFRRWTVHLALGDWRGKSFLDVGCGMGRNSYWPMTYGASGGCAADLDERSLASAQAQSRMFPYRRGRALKCL